MYMTLPVSNISVDTHLVIESLFCIINYISFFLMFQYNNDSNNSVCCIAIFDNCITLSLYSDHSIEFINNINTDELR